MHRRHDLQRSLVCKLKSEIATIISINETELSKNRRKTKSRKVNYFASLKINKNTNVVTREQMYGAL